MAKELQSAITAGAIIGLIDYYVWVYFETTNDYLAALYVGLATAALAYWGMKRK